MFKGTKVLDVHGHVSAPQAARNWIMGGLTTGAEPRNPFRSPAGGGEEGGAMARFAGGNPLSDEAFLAANKIHVDYMDERNIDVQVIGPRPFTMMGWMPPHLLNGWCNFTNDTIQKQVANFPDRFLGASILPQIATAPSAANCVPEFEKCVKEYGFIATYISPDPDGKRTQPGMNSPWFDPIYDKCEEWNVPVFVHGTNCLDPRIAHIPGNYQLGFVIETFLATRIIAFSDLFDRHPNLRICMAHGGGALDRFIASSNHRRARGKDMLNNLYFDTCLYEEDYLELSIKQWGVASTCFGSEAPGSGGAVRPETGKTSDDLLPIIDAFKGLSEEDKITILNKNPMKVFPGFAKALAAAPAASRA